LCGPFESRSWLISPRFGPKQCKCRVSPLLPCPPAPFLPTDLELRVLYATSSLSTTNNESCLPLETCHIYLLQTILQSLEDGPFHVSSYMLPSRRSSLGACDMRALSYKHGCSATEMKAQCLSPRCRCCHLCPVEGCRKRRLKPGHARKRVTGHTAVWNAVGRSSSEVDPRQRCSFWITK
jgi:hypothetical protein